MFAFMFFFLFNDTATTEIYTLSLHDALPISAAHGDMRLVVLGIALSIPIVVWGSGLLARLMNGVPWIIWLGGAVLGYVAGDMILDDEALRSLLGDARAPFAQIIPIALATVLGALGWWFAERPRRVASTK